MVQYTSRQVRLLNWIKRVIDGLDEQPRNLNQFLASAYLEGFKRKEVLEALDNYKELGVIFYSIDKNVLYSLKAIPRNLKDEMNEIFNGEAIK